MVIHKQPKSGRKQVWYVFPAGYTGVAGVGSYAVATIWNYTGNPAFMYVPAADAANPVRCSSLEEATALAENNPGS